MVVEVHEDNLVDSHSGAAEVLGNCVPSSIGLPNAHQASSPDYADDFDNSQDAVSKHVESFLAQSSHEVEVLSQEAANNADNLDRQENVAQVR